METATSFRTLEAISDSLDSLHELRVSVYDDHRFPPLWHTTAFRNAPKLQTVTINDRPDFFQLLPGWNRDDAYPSSFHETPDIHYDIFIFAFDQTESVGSAPQSARRDYRVLPLHDGPSKLSSLELHYHGRSTQLPFFGRRSLPSLASLLISAPSKTLDWSDTCTTLRTLPRLKSLSIEVIINSDQIFHILVSDQPSLRRLDLMNFDHRELVNMLDCRRIEKKPVLDELVLPTPLRIVDSEDWRWSNIWISVVTGGLNVVYRSHGSTIYIIPGETADVADAPSTSLLHS
ncbi:hypothetical protein DFS33DRAFT_1383131 [Desarmillaria ectypa]|nr:hypothetical protein DFS33DRAFT_1383131 [Desarmillaria ectypa]